MKVLCLDDDVTIARLVADVVLYLGHEPIVETDSVDAVVKHSRAGLGAAIVDLMMPKLDGVEVLAAFREHSPGCRRVLLTAAPTEEVVREAQRDGTIQLVIAKPPTIGDLRLALAWL